MKTALIALFGVALVALAYRHDEEQDYEFAKLKMRLAEMNHDLLVLAQDVQHNAQTLAAIQNIVLEIAANFSGQ